MYSYPQVRYFSGNITTLNIILTNEFYKDSESFKLPHFITVESHKTHVGVRYARG